MPLDASTMALWSSLCITFEICLIKIRANPSRPVLTIKLSHPVNLKTQKKLLCRSRRNDGC